MWFEDLWKNTDNFKQAVVQVVSERFSSDSSARISSNCMSTEEK